MITETVVTEPWPNPFEYEFAMLGGLKGDVAVKVVDARGVDCPVDWTAAQDPDDKVTWAVRVALREDWAYPVKVAVDWAERPASGERRGDEQAVMFSWEFKECDKPDCFRRVRPHIAYCCAECATAAAGRYEIHEHSEGCERRNAERGEYGKAQRPVRSEEETL